MAKKTRNGSKNTPRYGYSLGDNITHILVTIFTNGPSLAFSFFIIYSTLSLTDEKREAIFSSFFEKDSITIWPYVVIFAMAIIWFYQVKYLRQLHSSNMKSLGQEKTKLQSKLAGRDLGSSDY
ncbi:hypothetical protein [Avibacterium gallinarum]|uniref:hypothetical protein n=1 Tax=Avibacterium gallinarum TaxID=755 RepID=UPI0039FC7388